MFPTKTLILIFYAIFTKFIFWLSKYPHPHKEPAFFIFTTQAMYVSIVYYTYI